MCAWTGRAADDCAVGGACRVLFRSGPRACGGALTCWPGVPAQRADRLFPQGGTDHCSGTRAAAWPCCRVVPRSGAGSSACLGGGSRHLRGEARGHLDPHWAGLRSELARHCALERDRESQPHRGWTGAPGLPALAGGCRGHSASGPGSGPRGEPPLGGPCTRRRPCARECGERRCRRSGFGSFDNWRSSCDAERRSTAARCAACGPSAAS